MTFDLFRIVTIVLLSTWLTFNTVHQILMDQRLAATEALSHQVSRDIDDFGFLMKAVSDRVSTLELEAVRKKPLPPKKKKK